MSKLIIKNKYGIAPNELLNNDKLSLKAKGMFTFLQSKPDNWKFSVKRIGIQNLDGKSSIGVALKELEKYGVLCRRSTKDSNGKWNGYDYILSEKPFTEKPSTEKPLTENRATLSKIDNSNKDIVKRNVDISIEKKLSFSKNDIILTRLLYSIVKENYPFLKEKTEKQIQVDYIEMNRLHNIDGFNYKQIEWIIRWATQDSFWKQNIRSVNKLRKQFDNLIIKAKGQYDNKQKNKIVTI